MRRACRLAFVRPSIAIAASAAAAISLACRAETVHGPKAEPNATKPNLEYSYIPEGAQILCRASSYACGGVFPLLAPNPAVMNDYVIVGPFDLGGYARTWSPGGYRGLMDMFGTFTVKRGNSPEQTHDVSCTKDGTECGDGFRDYHTCDVVKNTVSGISHHVAQFQNVTYVGTFSESKVCLGPNRTAVPRFSMTSESQESGDGGTLANSAGHTVTLANSTTGYGNPEATNATWLLDGQEIATGNGTSVALPAGTFTVALRLDDGAENEAEASATITAVDDSEAGSCDDPLTDVVETNCDGESGEHEIGVAGGYQTVTKYCWTTDYYRWSEVQQSYAFLYRTEVCWFAE